MVSFLIPVHRQQECCDESCVYHHGHCLYKGAVSSCISLSVNDTAHLICAIKAGEAGNGN